MNHQSERLNTCYIWRDATRHSLKHFVVIPVLPRGVTRQNVATWTIDSRECLETIIFPPSFHWNSARKANADQLGHARELQCVCFCVLQYHDAFYAFGNEMCAHSCCKRKAVALVAGRWEFLQNHNNVFVDVFFLARLRRDAGKLLNSIE